MEFNNNNKDGTIVDLDVKENYTKYIPYLSPRRKQAREYAQSRGFADEYELEGWRYFNSIQSD